MTTASPAYQAAPSPTGWPRRAEAWLDAKGRGAWIAAMVLGFILFWPVGLALAIYITATSRWSHPMSQSCRSPRHARMQHAAFAAARPSGNAAFDTYKADMLTRLEDEQRDFEAFLQRLREAKDKAEFDAFMTDRARAAAASPDDAATQ